MNRGMSSVCLDFPVLVKICCRWVLAVVSPIPSMSAVSLTPSPGALHAQLAACQAIELSEGLPRKRRHRDLKLRLRNRSRPRHAALAIPALALSASFCGPRSADLDLFHCAKLIEQVSGVFEIRGVEPFGKPGEDVVQQLAGVTFLTLALPQSS
jgi:hypothetical protein